MRGNLKKIVFIAMLLLTAGSWWLTIAGGYQKDDEYNSLIKEAKRYEEKKIYIDAIECYKKAIKIYPDILENKINLADIYMKAKMNNSYEDYCINLIDEYESNEKPVIMLGEFYFNEGKIDKAVSVYKTFLNENEDSKEILEKLNSLKSEFDLSYNTYSNVSSFRNGYAVFKKGDKYGIMDNYSDVKIKAAYDFAGVYDRLNPLKLSPVFLDGEYFYIDLEGNRRLVSDIEYDYLGSFSDKEIAVFRRDNFYGYLDKDFNEFEETFDYASSFFNNPCAAVKKNEKWVLVNEDMKKISNEEYEEIKIDDLGCSANSGVIFAKKNGKYMMLDLKGLEITGPMFDDADFFVSADEYAAIKKDGKWGFVDYKGNIAINPKYDAAFSFSCGLAPVKIDGKWGYINSNEEIVIKPQFDDARPFNKVGITSVMKSEWHILKLKYYEKGGK